MAFDPSKYGLKPFNPSKYGLTPVNESVVNEQHPGLSWLERTKIKNLSTSPESAVRYLQSQGFEANIDPKGEIRLRKPGETQWHRVEGGLELSDLSDVITDITGAAASVGGAALAGGSTFGAGTIAGAAGGAAAHEAARRGAAKALGMGDESLGSFAKGVGGEALMGAGAEVGGKLVGSALKAGAKALLPARMTEGGILKTTGRALQAPARAPGAAIEHFQLGAQGRAAKKAASDALLDFTEKFKAGLLPDNEVTAYLKQNPAVVKEIETILRRPLTSHADLIKATQKITRPINASGEQAANVTREGVTQVKSRLFQAVNDAEDALTAVRRSKDKAAIAEARQKLVEIKRLSSDPAVTGRLDEVERLLTRTTQDAKGRSKFLNNVNKAKQQLKTFSKDYAEELGGLKPRTRGIGKSITGLSGKITAATEKGARPTKPSMGALIPQFIPETTRYAGPAAAIATAAGASLGAPGAAAIGATALSGIGKAIEALADRPLGKALEQILQTKGAKTAAMYLLIKAKTDPEIASIARQFNITPTTR